jgi:TonB family protein
MLIYCGGAFAQDGSILRHDDNGSSKDTTPSETGVLRISAGALDQLIVSKTDAITPEAARKAKVSGTVIVSVKVSEDGRVVRATATSGPAQLRDAAAETVQRWTYRPYVVDGKAVAVRSTVTVMFYPNR